ncbi:hypothetical protein Godav_027869 [Gossypium davidsonii]|nr:hypothetical protein [Gossypium davidsonii]
MENFCHGALSTQNCMK